MRVLLTAYPSIFDMMSPTLKMPHFPAGPWGSMSAIAIGTWSVSRIPTPQSSSCSSGVCLNLSKSSRICRKRDATSAPSPIRLRRTAMTLVRASTAATWSAASSVEPFSILSCIIVAASSSVPRTIMIKRSSTSLLRIDVQHSTLSLSD